MKNWKVPAIILPLLFFSGCLAFSANWVDGAILGVSWLVIMLATAIWLLLVLPWKRIKIKLISYELMRNWKAPGIMLILLILAMVLRWGELGSRTLNSNTDKYKVDHWNGAVYKDSFTVSGFKETIEHRASYDSESLTEMWKYALGIDVIWLLIAVSKIKRKSNSENNLPQ